MSHHRPSHVEPPGRGFSDAGAALLAVATAAGALVATELTLVVPAALAVGALLWRRPWLFGLGVVLAASTLGHRAEAGLAPVPEGPVRAEVTLVSDPEEAFGAVRVDVRLGSRLLEAWAYDEAGAALEDRLSGERVTVVGRTEPPPADAPWMAQRHVVGRLTVDEVLGARAGDVPSRLANGLRRTLAEGAASLPPTTRSLFAGFVLGDDRDQGVVVTDDFLGSGLSHLLAVSGQNVAFVLAVAGPALRRLPLTQRLPAALAVIGFFVLVTRAEPSVLRAGVMAGIATTATVLGREARGRRTLALAVTALILVDPFLVTSIGFGLSVAASAGILLLGPPLRRALRGPRVLTEPIAITLAAQAGVAPLLVATFEGVPVASIPANLLAGPCAGPVVVWGLTAGLVAGVVGGPVAEVLHMPTRVLLGWVEAVAGWAAGLPLGELQAVHLVVLLPAAAVTVAAVAARRAGGTGQRQGAGVAAVLAAVVAVAAGLAPLVHHLAVPPAPVIEVAGGAVLWRAEPPGGRPSAVLVLIEEPAPAELLEALRRHQVPHLDVVVATGGGRAEADAVAALRDRYRPRLVLAPEDHEVPVATVPAPGDEVRIGTLVLRVDVVRPHLEVTVEAVEAGR